jgi:ParB family protein of integrating conjugative element (PFGI_1 class)
MASVTRKELATKLRSEPFKRTGADVPRASDPIVDTAMVVTLDELRPYDRNPRKTLNPRYEEIKASIRERGLDSPPAITRRPGELHFIIRNGGNTRLAILGELWTETAEERFFKIPCLFRPWTARGEIIALTGHLAENELRGNLSFIERAMAVDQLRELYEQEAGKALTQKEFAARLTAEGFPVTQPHISRMQDAVEHLLPAIPKLLYGGLGKHQVERLIALRNVASGCWTRHAMGKDLGSDFPTFFRDVLATFDGELATFHVQRVQDELIGQLRKQLGSPLLEIAVEFCGADRTQTVAQDLPIEFEPLGLVPEEPVPNAEPTRVGERDVNGRRSGRSIPRQSPAQTEGPESEPDPEPDSARSNAAVAQPSVTSSAPHESAEGFASEGGRPTRAYTPNVGAATSLWMIAPDMDTPEELRGVIPQLAREIAQEGQVEDAIDMIDEGIGFVCHNHGANTPRSPFARGLLSLLSALSVCQLKNYHSTTNVARLGDHIGPLLEGVMVGAHSTDSRRLSDEGFLKLVRMIRLVRRLVDLQTEARQPIESRPGQSA